MTLTRVLALIVGMMVTGNCPAAEVVAATGPAKVEIRQVGSHWELLVNHQPFYIKGAGLEFGDQEKLAAAGGNSFRTWRTDNGQETGRQILDRAQKNGLYVTMGLDVARERQGFNYGNSNNVAQQLADIRAQVLQFKDHPAVLMWDIGNELNLNSTNPLVWDAVNQISKMIHQLDPNHPTTTSLAGVSKEVVDEIKRRAPDLDLLCFQSYADIVNLPHYLKAAGWSGPYVVTEWGATGHWECGKTSWAAPIEDNSSIKAGLYAKRYETAIASDTNQCLGSYVFLWGQKQERTPTWYGMFLASGESTETVDVMEHLWTGRWPENRSPHIEGIWLNGKTAEQNVHLSAGQRYPVKVEARPDSITPFKYTFEIMEESDAKTVGGDFEAQPQPLAGLVTINAAGEAHVKAPAKPGAYRLFVYVFNGHGKAAYGNIPFYVDVKNPSVVSQL